MRDPICIFKPGEDTAIGIAELAQLLEQNALLERKALVLTIAGRYRQGKSFLMNFIIRYLRAQGTPNWMSNGAQHEVLGGFEWKHTRKPVTQGVLVWPEFFQIRDDSGEEIVVILMDTQGVFDTDSSIKDCTSIFALSVLLSSIQIFNVKQNIQGDDLSQLELFAQFGRLVCSGNSSENVQSSVKPFQDLIFLVRDWAYPDEFPYGWEGGEGALNRELGKTGSSVEQATMRANIKSCFESLRCFLMPHPGKTVDTSSKFNGKLSDIDEEMVKGIKSFIEEIFRPNNLKPKRIHGKELTVRELMHYVQNYVAEMHSDQLPTPETLYIATVNAANAAVVNSCFEKYQVQLSELVTNGTRDPALFKELHSSAINDVLTQFDQAAKMGDADAIAAARDDLKTRIDSTAVHYNRAHSLAHKKTLAEAEMKELLDTQTRLNNAIKRKEEGSAALEKQLEILRLEGEERMAEIDAAQQGIDEALKEGRKWRLFPSKTIGKVIKRCIDLWNL